MLVSSILYCLFPHSQCRHLHLLPVCRVPTKFEPDQRLASWVMWQRGKYHQKKLPDEYIAKLDEIGFVWKVQRKGRRINHMSDVRGGYKNSSGFIIWSPSTSNEFWEAQLEKLKAYKAKVSGILS